MDQLNANMDMTSTLLGQLCQHIPTGECSLEARETASPNLTDTEVSGRKQHRRAESFSSDEEADGPCTKSRKDSDAISVTASEDEVQNLLDGVTGGSTHKNVNHEGADDHDAMLKCHCDEISHFFFPLSFTQNNLPSCTISFRPERKN